MHLDKEVKKRGAKRLHWDASYKEPKHLSQYHGNQIFHALITATNEIGEIRIQFHVVSDGQDQFNAAIAAFIDTCNNYGQAPPELFFTDNVFFKILFSTPDFLNFNSISLYS